MGSGDWLSLSPEEYLVFICKCHIVVHYTTTRCGCCCCCCCCRCCGAAVSLSVCLFVQAKMHNITIDETCCEWWYELESSPYLLNELMWLVMLRVFICEGKRCILRHDKRDHHYSTDTRTMSWGQTVSLFVCLSVCLSVSVSLAKKINGDMDRPIHIYILDSRYCNSYSCRMKSCSHW